MHAALGHVDTWIFDLDQTLYPHEANIMSQVEEKMAAFMIRETGLSPAEAAALRDQYLAAAKARFAKLDANADGFIEADEASGHRWARGGAKPAAGNRIRF